MSHQGPPPSRQTSQYNPEAAPFVPNQGQQLQPPPVAPTLYPPPSRIYPQPVEQYGQPTAMPPLAAEGYQPMDTGVLPGPHEAQGSSRRPRTPPEPHHEEVVQEQDPAREPLVTTLLNFQERILRNEVITLISPFSVRKHEVWFTPSKP